MRTGFLQVTLYGCAALAAVAGAGEAKPKTEKKATPGTRMDYRPFLSYSVGPSASKSPIVLKGLAIKVAPEATVCFDTGALSLAAGWTGGFLELSKTNIGDLKGSLHAVPVGERKFGVAGGPGWAKSGVLTDPRPGGYGALPREWAHYKGLYLHGDKVILSYTVGDCNVLELPGFATSNGTAAFTRTIQIGPSKNELLLRVCDSIASSGAPAVGIAVRPAGSVVERTPEGGTQLKLPPLAAPVTFQIILAGAAQKLVDPVKVSELPDLAQFCKGGPPRWAQVLETECVRGKDDSAYTVDTLTVPEDNPWNAWMRLSGLDFFADGRAAVCTLNGDVWIVSGIGAAAEKLSWKRYAAGLYEPLGLRIVGGKVFVLGRDQITRLHDLNDDGEADYYENFNNACATHPSYHAFALDLDTDSEGNFYFARGGNWIERDLLPQHSGVFKVLADGSKLEVVATGLRAPNGLGIGPKDELTVSDNQGHWTPASKINWVRPGGFYGHVYDPRTAKREAPASFDPPLCWIPITADNSSGGQVWATSDRWGPLQGRMLHTSYGKSSLFLVMHEQAGGMMQGGVVRFPLTFGSGIMRGRFNPADGQLYVCGLKGWQTSAGRDGCLQRVRYTGKPAYLPADLHVMKDGIRIGFTTPLDKGSACDVENYGIEQWNYRWTEKYGSDDYSPSNPDKKGRDAVRIQSAKLLDDGKTVALEIPGLKPVMQMGIKLKLKAADGAEISAEIFNTINCVP